MGKYAHQKLTKFWKASPEAFASAESRAVYVTKMLTDLCYVYKAPKGEVSCPWLRVCLTYSFPAGGAWHVLFRAHIEGIL